MVLDMFGRSQEMHMHHGEFRHKIYRFMDRYLNNEKEKD